MYKPEFSQSPEQPFTVSQSVQSVKNVLASNFFAARRYFDMFALYFQSIDVDEILKDDKNEPIMTRWIKSYKRVFMNIVTECMQKNPMLMNDMQTKLQKMVDEEGFSKGYASNFLFLDFFARNAVRDHSLSFFKPLHSKGGFSRCPEKVFSNFLSLSARIQIICDLSLVPFKTWDFFLNNPKLQRLQEVVKLDLFSNRFSLFGNGDSDKGWKQANANVGILPSPYAEECFIKCNQLEFDLSTSAVEKHLLEAMQCIDWDTIDDADEADLLDCDHFFDRFQCLANQTPKTLTDLILIKPWSRIFAQRRLCLQNFYPDDTSLLAHFDLECRQALDHARTRIFPVVTEYITVIKSLQGAVMARVFDATGDDRYGPERADKTAQAFALRYQHDLLMNDDTSGDFKANQYHDLEMRSVDLEESLYLFNQCGKEASNHHVLTIESLLQDNGLSLLRRQYLRKSRVMHPDRSHDGAGFCWMKNLYNHIKDCIARVNLQSLKHCPRSQDDHHQPENSAGISPAP